MKKILIVEDEKNIVLSLKMYLKKLGFEILAVDNGVDGVKMAQKYIPDLIMLDIVLPKMNGYLVCEALKQEDTTSKIPIVFISAKSREDDINKAFKVGGDHYIVKPFNHKEIKKVVDKYLKEDK